MEARVHVVMGRGMVHGDAAEVRRRAAQAARVVVDVGAGDGRYAYRLARAHPDWLCVALDANADGLREVSRRAGRKAERGGAPNLWCLRAPAESLPGVLAGLADEVSVLYPWGTLRRAVLDPDPTTLADLAALGRPGARLLVVANDAGDCGDPRAVAARLPAGYRAAGLREVTVAVRLVAPATSWGRRLSRGRPAVALVVEARVGR